MHWAGLEPAPTPHHNFDVDDENIDVIDVLFTAEKILQLTDILDNISVGAGSKPALFHSAR